MIPAVSHRFTPPQRFHTAPRFGEWKSIKLENGDWRTYWRNDEIVVADNTSIAKAAFQENFPENAEAFKFVSAVNKQGNPISGGLTGSVVLSINRDFPSVLPENAYVYDKRIDLPKQEKTD